MTTLTTLPDLAKPFELMKLTDDLLERTDRNTLRGMAIILLLEKNQNNLQVIGIIHEECRKFPDQMALIIGEDLVKRVINF